jgi:hypothetical protein
MESSQETPGLVPLSRGQRLVFFPLYGFMLRAARARRLNQSSEDKRECGKDGDAAGNYQYAFEESNRVVASPVERSLHALRLHRGAV